jgi:hypothetical protein
MRRLPHRKNTVQALTERSEGAAKRNMVLHLKFFNGLV